MEHRRSLIVLALLALLFSLAPITGHTQSIRPTGLDLLERDAGSIEMLYGSDPGALAFVSGDMPVPAGAPADPTGAARFFLARYGSIFGIVDAGKELAVVSAVDDERGNHHITFSQQQNGVEVYNAQIKAHLSPSGKTVTSIGSGFIPNLRLSVVTPQISADAAASFARDAMPQGEQRTDPRLVIYPFNGLGRVRTAALAWLVEVADDSIPARNLYVINALNGRIIDVVELLYHGRTGQEIRPPALEQRYSDRKQGFAFDVPAGWTVTPGALTGRHHGFDPVLITSFSLSDNGRQLSVPSGEAAVLVTFEDNDCPSDQSVNAYAWENLASIEYRPTHQDRTFGSNVFSEYVGDLGRLLVTAARPNVYSVLLYAQNDPARDPEVARLLASLSLQAGQPVNISPADRGEKAPGRDLKPASSAGEVVVPVPLRMPWAAQTGVSHTFTGGPHGGSVDWSCSAYRTREQMSGLDFGMATGTPILAAARGTVYRRENVTGIGNILGIEHDGGFATEYWHLSAFDARATLNALVEQGQKIGESGAYGNAAHLHLEFRTQPDHSPYPADGIPLDGYGAWGYERKSDGKWFNYQGTLTQGGATRIEMDYDRCETTIYSHFGSDATVEANVPGVGEIATTNASCPTGSYRAEYFKGEELGGAGVYARCEDAPLAHDWAEGGPGRGVPADHFSARWFGAFNFANDTYTFLTQNDDGIRVWVDDELVIDSWKNQSATNYSARKAMTAGEHLVKVEYYEQTSSAVTQVHWWPNNSDPNDNRVLKNQDLVWGAIQPSNDEDVYFFDGTNQQRATIVMDEGVMPALNPYLALYAPDGSLIAMDDDSGSSDGAAIMDLQLPQNGRYRVVAQSKDAASGGLYSLKFGLREAGFVTRQTYSANHGTNLPGMLLRTEGQPAIGDADVDNAHDFAQTSYNYYWNTYRRDSYDNNGTVIVSTAHYGTNYANAFWNGRQLTYGDGMVALDVVAHELTHGVIENTANLEYNWQSGALNESLADVFATMIDRDDWLLGEDLPEDALAGRDAIRSLSNPKQYGQPDHARDWVATCSDDEGVHANSGITNKAYYNIATNAAVGKDRAERIFYQMLVYHMTPSTTLEQARAFAIEATTELYPKDEAAQNAVRAGFDAVGLDGQWNPPSNDCVCAASAVLSDRYANPDGRSAFNVATTLYQVRDRILSDGAVGLRYRHLYEKYTGRVTLLLAHNPSLRREAAAILREYEPGLRELVSGEPVSAQVTPQMIAHLQQFLDHLAAQDIARRGGALAQTIAEERATLPLESLIGLRFDEAWAHVLSLESTPNPVMGD